MPDALDLLTQTPLAIAPRYLGHMLDVLQGRRAAATPRAPVVRGRVVHGVEVTDGIAVVPIVGPIMQRADLFSDFGAVSVADVRATIGAALADPSVQGILAIIDSPGGQVAGVADLADALYAARGAGKPMVAVADEGMFSAAYWIGSALGPVVLPRTGSVGSIGALVVHQDVTQALDKLGVKMTVVRSGAKKAMFSPFQPLTDEARVALQVEVDRIRDLFVSAVARYRDLDAATLVGFEGGTFEGAAAVTAGLADAVNTVDGTYLALKMKLLETPTAGTARLTAAAPPRQERTIPMSTETPVPVPAPLAVTASAEPDTVEGKPAVPATPWTAATSIVNIETARREAAAAATAAANTRAAEILQWCAVLGKADMAATYTASNMTLEQVRNDLMQQTASASFDLPLGRSMAADRHYDSVDTIYARRKAAIKEAGKNRRYY